jgi:DNA-directed RNA polymerase subunit RPC12/RpoP
MPIFNLICMNCGKKRRVVRAQGWTSLQEEVRCSECSTRLERDPSGSGPAALVKEVIDNGVMTKPLERFADAERLHKERIEVEEAAQKGQDSGRTIR